MPKEEGIGYGILTPLKIEHLAHIFDMHLRITQAVLRKHPAFRQEYRYIDLTAGRGCTPDGNKGGALLFAERAEAPGVDMPYSADFIERQEAHLTELQACIAEAAQRDNWRGRYHFHQGEYQNEVTTILPKTDDAELGIVFVDHSGDPPHVDALQYIAKVRPRMEILLYVPTTNIKRVYHLTDRLLSDAMTEIGKQYWLVRKPLTWDSMKWTFLLGSNTSLFRNYDRIGFVRLDSPEGQAIFPALNFSRKQRAKKEQLSLL